MMRVVFVGLALVALAGPLRAEEEHSFWWYTKAKLACLPDVTRLCASALPSEDKVRDCMKDKKKLVSATCAEFYPGGKNAD
jgi:hypothetical protein